MGGLSRYDFFRIILPGAIVVFLIVAGLRILLVGGGPSDRTLIDLQTQLENPLAAIAVAFAVGLFLYFLDPAYSTAAFYQDIPSTHLRSKLAERNVKGVNALSLFFLASDKLLPAEMRERALLYGALFRVGFQVIVFTIMAALLLPCLHLLLYRNLGPLPVNWSWDLFVAIAVIAGTGLVPLIGFLLNRRKRGYGVALRPVLALAVTFLISAALWLNVVATFLPTQFRHFGWRVAVTAVFVAHWLVLRMLGPLGDRLASWRRPRSGKPDNPYPYPTVQLLDALAGLDVLLGLVALSSKLVSGQVLGVASLAVLGLALSGARKHERQLHGIYSNQNFWIDGNLGEILKLAPR